ncbi:Uncharacterised protein [Mycoplasmopsis citelli]|uniref:Transmembrane protein n=1 Tax=Mycoplasmopsis citelli TaxID=171281 RepID=A0A449B192_9BACT|nr:hypothetical protein [Mycoplasmopsis citelli]VEU74341.1 Uncharacterised protein [Mycoplasmopsis citelli]
MTPKQLISTWWSTQGFFVEVLASFLLVFLVLLFMFIAKAFKIKWKNMFLSLAFTLATFVMYIQVWASAKYAFNNSPSPIGNPIFVLMISILQGHSKAQGLVRGYSFTWQYKGIAYLIFGEFFGFLLAITCFLVLLNPMKKYLSKINPHLENVKSIKLIDIFKKEDCTLIGYSVKETIFLFVFCTLLGYVFYIQKPQYGATNFDAVLALSIVVFVLLAISSYFGFFAFNIFIDLFVSGVNFFSETSIFNSKTKEASEDWTLLKESKFKQKINLIYIYQMLISSSITIIAPIVISFISIGIYQLSGGDGLNF